uniref:Transposase (putative) gypsy type domain-containing protein n=1 Tax=Fagus sylvatica TaxID=28930 RepID=A0A2N9ERF1_FAGSY
MDEARTDGRVYLQNREKVKGYTGGGPVGEPLMLKSEFILASLSQSFQLFFVGVSRFAESNLGPPPLEGYVSSDSVLHWLAAELYSIVYPALSTWEAVRSRMAVNEAEWSLPLSEELPEGLSDESVGRAMRKDNIDRIRRRYQIPDDVVLRIPDSDERACCPKYEGDVALYEADLRAGLHFPMQPFVRELLDFLSLAPGQVNPNGWRTIISCMVMWRVNSNGQEDLTVDEFLFCYELCHIVLPRASGHLRIVTPILGSSRDYLCLIGFGRTNISSCVVTTGRGFHKRILGILSKFVGRGGLLRHLVVGSSIAEFCVGREDIEDRRYTIFIEPDLLASFSFGPVPSSAVKALLKANKKRADTMKLNKSRLRQLAQSGEVATDPVVLKRKRAGEGSSRRAEEVPTHPPPREAIPFVKDVPPIVMVNVDPNPPVDPSVATINQSPHVAMDRAKAAFTSRDMDDYAAAHTEDVHYLLVHSLMQGLNEAMVMSQRCISVEEDLATLRAKSMADEAELKNTRRAVLKLTRERKDTLDEAERVKVEMKAKDKDVEVVVATKDKAVVDLQHLVSQVKGSKAAAVSEFRASEAFEDINTRYFLSDFKAFRKQAAQRFPGLDFSALQPYDDEDSVVDVPQGDQGSDEKVSSKQS